MSRRTSQPLTRIAVAGVAMLLAPATGQAATITSAGPITDIPSLLT